VVAEILQSLSEILRSRIWLTDGEVRYGVVKVLVGRVITDLGYLLNHRAVSQWPA
jgi:hypothetical protein